MILTDKNFIFKKNLSHIIITREIIAIQGIPVSKTDHCLNEEKKKADIGNYDGEIFFVDAWHLSKLNNPSLWARRCVDFMPTLSYENLMLKVSSFVTRFFRALGRKFPIFWFTQCVPDFCQYNLWPYIFNQSVPFVFKFRGEGSDENLVRLSLLEFAFETRFYHVYACNQLMPRKSSWRNCCVHSIFGWVSFHYTL